MKIPIPYQVIIERLERQAFKGVLSKGAANQVMSYIFRMPKDRLTAIFKEMTELKLIKFQQEQGGRYIILNGYESRNVTL